MVRIVRLVIAAFLLLSVLPMEAFCKDAHCIEETGHAAVACDHALTLPAVLPQADVQPLEFSSVALFQPYQSIYQNPVLALLIKPPIAVS